MTIERTFLYLENAAKNDTIIVGKSPETLARRWASTKET